MDIKKKNNRSFGAIGEGIALGFLQKNGYQILNKNYRVGRMGEIDIIAREGEYICFVEVKTRSSSLFGMPSEAVTYRKQAGIRKLAAVYIHQFRLLNENIRFDVVEIMGEKKSNGFFEVSTINLLKNAF